MTPDKCCRRPFIHWGTLGLATSIAGCNTSDIPGQSTELPTGEDRPDNKPDTNDTAPDGKPNTRPSDSPASFEAASANYSLHDLSYKSEKYQTKHLEPLLGGSRSIFRHPENRIFDITINDENTASATLTNTNVTRDIICTLTIRDAEGTLQSTDQRLEATDGGHQTHELEFDISDINLPHNSGSIYELTARDTHDEASFEYITKRHQFVIIPHKNGIYACNSEALNTDRYTRNESNLRDAPNGVKRGDEWVQKNSSPAGHVDYIDTDDERIVFLAVREAETGTPVKSDNRHYETDQWDVFDTGDAATPHRAVATDAVRVGSPDYWID